MRHLSCFITIFFNLHNRVAICVLLLAASLVTLAQEPQARGRTQLGSVPKGLPSDVLQQVEALGLRMRTDGKEQIVLEGDFVDEKGKQKAMRVVYQLSGMVRIEGAKDKAALTFDGDLTRGLADRNDESLIDTFVMDTPEGMLYSLRTGASMQLLGRGFGPDPQTGPNNKGARYDIYQVSAPVRSHKDNVLEVRRYYFDSSTGLLSSTRYSDSTGRKVETRFLNWGNVDGSAYPGRVERYENGRLVFSFVVAAASGRPRQDAATFK